MPQDKDTLGAEEALRESGGRVQSSDGNRRRDHMHSGRPCPSPSSPLSAAELQGNVCGPAHVRRPGVRVKEGGCSERGCVCVSGSYSFDADETG